MKESCEYLREQVKNVIDFEKKKIVPVTKKTKDTSRRKIISYFWKKNLKKAL